LAETASRTALENALFLYAPSGRQADARAFLEGLAVDELRYLAGFLGSCILTTSTVDLTTWEVIYNRAKAGQRKLKSLPPSDREDLAHKLLLVTEFAVRCGDPCKH
jgi:hypothetical protein